MEIELEIVDDRRRPQQGKQAGSVLFGSGAERTHGGSRSSGGERQHPRKSKTKRAKHVEEAVMTVKASISQDLNALRNRSGDTGEFTFVVPSAL